jgi:hypothetical protein
MTYVKIEGGIVVQKQPYPGDGFIEAQNDVLCGTIYDGTYFTAPIAPAKIPDVTEQQLDELFITAASF